MLGSLHSSQGFCVPGVQWGSGHCSCSVRGILSLAGRADRCEQLLDKRITPPGISSSGEVSGGKSALPCPLGVFLKAQGQSGLHQLRSRAKEVASLSETAFGAKPCSMQAHRWCPRCCSYMEMELHLRLVPLEHCKCFVTSRSGLDNLKEQHLLILRC